MIGSLFKHKEKLPTSVCSRVIYEYKCLLCNKQYIGSTIRQFQCRISEHMGVSVRTGLPMANNPNSAIYDHRYDAGHQIHKDQFRIKKSCHNRYDVRLLEALYIKKEKPELNDGLPVELALLHWGVVLLPWVSPLVLKLRWISCHVVDIVINHTCFVGLFLGLVLFLSFNFLMIIFIIFDDTYHF